MPRLTLTVGTIALCMTMAFSSFAASAANQCRNDNIRTERDMAECWDQQHHTTDRALNATYNKLIAALTRGGESGQVEAVKNSERAWVVFRDAECKLETWDSRDGTAFSDYLTICLIKLTKERTARFQWMLDNP